MNELLTKCISDYKTELPFYQKAQDYYKGKTDAMESYQQIDDRSNLKAYCNYIKKFIKEEVAYILGNKVTYISRTGNKNIVESITNNLAHWSEKHDKDLLKNALKFSVSYELYYVDDNGFNAKILTPLNSYLKTDSYGNPEMFLHFFYKDFDTTTEYMDVYYPDRIEHYKGAYNIVGITENNPISVDENYFGFVPVGTCQIAEEGIYDTLFSDIKGIQDAYETNLSDITNEISDFRNAYLKVINADLDDTTYKDLKKMGALKVGKDGDIEWLIKNINDSFIQNTLKTLKENMYEISNHINSNEKLQSNTSSLALRTRLIALEQKCKDNADAVTDCIKSRLKALFYYLDVVKNQKYDYRDIKPKYTVAIPQDDLMMAQIASQIPESLFSKKTLRAQFSFCDNPDEEEQKVQKEEESTIEGMKLLNSVISSQGGGT